VTVRVGLVSPYPWDVPGGVVAHIRDLAEQLLVTGHEVSVLTPVDDDDLPLPDHVVRAGRTVPVPYNGSVSRLIFGPVSLARVRRWLADGHFDVLHVHSPETLSLSLLTVMNAKGPIVATFHAYNPRSRILSLLQTPLQAYLEKVQGRIAVSPAARRTIVEHLGGDAVIIPNGVAVARYRDAEPMRGFPWPDGAIGFVGRIDEQRKGLAVLTAAFELLAARRPGLQLLVAGPGDRRQVQTQLPARLRDQVHLLGEVSEADKARLYRSVDVFAAPNTGGESFGLILLEAMAAGTPVVASDLDPFRQVLDGGRAGRLVPVGREDALAAACESLLAQPSQRRELVNAGNTVVAQYDWPAVAERVVQVYETVIAGVGAGVAEEPEETEEEEEEFPRLAAAASRRFRAAVRRRRG
jgi:phosphatidylinositol alpha-mannosyltransferase